MRVKTRELSGPALDWAVAKCEGDEVRYEGGCIRPALSQFVDDDWYQPSTDWPQGGPIIEREITKVFRNVGGTWSAMVLKDVSIPPEDRGTSLALTRRAQWNGAGPTPLIAAMRCYVMSKLGNEVDIPKELL